MKMKSVMTGLGVTMAVGSAALMMTGAMSKPSIAKTYKKKAAKAIKSMESILDDMQYMLK